MNSAYQSLSDQELLQLFISYDNDAYEAIYDRYWNILWPYAKKMLKDEDGAKDVLQDSFIILYNRREKLSLVTYFQGYFFRIVRNRILLEIKHNKKYIKEIEGLQLYLDQDTSAQDQELGEIEQQVLIQIEKEINALPTELKKVFEMCHRQYLSHKDVAVELGKSRQTVKGQVQKALVKIRQKVSKPFLLYVMYVILYSQLDFSFPNTSKWSVQLREFFLKK